MHEVVYLQKSFSQHAGSKKIQGADGNTSLAEVLRDHLALFSDSEAAIDGMRRVCEDRLVHSGVASPAHRSA